MYQRVPVVMIEAFEVGGHASPQTPELAWFSTALHHARDFNTEMYLLGDMAAADFPIAPYLATAADFQQHYQHLSTNHFAFERFCIERWFALLTFMEDQNIEQVLYLDSDVLLLCNAEQEWERWRGCDVTLALGASAATAFLRRSTLAAFVEFVRATYAEPANGRLEKMQQIFAEMRAKDLPGGISDMYLWQQFVQVSGCRVCEMTQRIDSTTWDHNINASDGYVMRNGIKALYRIKDKYYGLYIAHDQLVEFKALHFQGGAKRLLPSYGVLPLRVYR